MLNNIEFAKMHGSGNHFVLIDNRDTLISREEAPEAARRFCARRVGIGADGLILIEKSDNADFRWGFYNADGSEAEMCGNGGRCAARFAFMKGIAPEEMRFETLAGIISAHVKGTRVKLQLSPPFGMFLDRELHVNGKPVKISFVNTGVPHVVVVVDDVEDVPVVETGRALRQHDFFAPDGTNVNFTSRMNRNRIAVRTYERGVEDETLACGTGSVASAIVMAAKGLAESPVEVQTRGGEILTIYHDLLENGEITDVFLEGESVHVYDGVTAGQD